MGLMRIAAASGVLSVLFSLQPGPGPLVRELGTGLYAYVSDSDSSCNSTFLVTPEGILVVDTGFDGREAEKLLAAIRRISPAPVRYVVNTHYHRDHQGGNGIVGPEATVVSTEWTRQRTVRFIEVDVAQLARTLEGPALQSLRSCRFKPAEVTFTDRLVIHLGGQRVELWHPGKGHTLGDLIVMFPAQRVAAMGDLCMNRSSPAMDEGSVLNWIATLQRVLDGPAQTVVPGHFEVASRADLQRFHDYLADLRDRVEALQQAGASVEQVRRRIQMPEYADFRQFPRFHATFADNAEVVYREIAR